MRHDVNVLVLGSPRKALAKGLAKGMPSFPAKTSEPLPQQLATIRMQIIRDGTSGLPKRRRQEQARHPSGGPVGLIPNTLFWLVFPHDEPWGDLALDMLLTRKYLWHVTGW
jgi:hypothetical protein